MLALLSHLQPGLLGDADLGSQIPGAADRLSYPIGYWNGLAALLAIGAVLLRARVARARRESAEVRSDRVAAPALLAIWLTDSRVARPRP